MLKQILTYVQDASGAVNAIANLSSFSPDSLYVGVDGYGVASPCLLKADGSVATFLPSDIGKSREELESSYGKLVVGSEPITASDLHKILVNVYLKNSSGKDIATVNNVPLSDFLLLSDYQGNSEFSRNEKQGHVGGKDYDDAFGYYVRVPLGKLILVGDDVLTVQVSGSIGHHYMFDADGKLVDYTGIRIAVWADDSYKGTEKILRYDHVSGIDSQNFNFRNASSLYGIGMTTKTLYVNDYFGSVAVDVMGCIVKGRCISRQAEIKGDASGTIYDMIPFSPLWTDDTGWTQNIDFTSCSDMDFLVVGEEFHPERAGREQKDLRDFAGFYSSFATDDPDKAQVFAYRNSLATPKA